jgi:hypothetical protein
MAENRWTSLGENAWTSLGENTWTSIARKMTAQRATLTESNRQRTHNLGASIQVLPDGRRLVTWGTHRPRLYEKYVLQWEW